MVKNVFNMKRKLKLSHEAKAIIFDCFIFLITFLTTPLSLWVGLCPFGIALCASAKRSAPFAFVGAFASCIFFMDASLVYLISFLALLILRIIASLLKKQEKKSLLLGEKRGLSFLSSLFYESVVLRVFLSLAICLGIGLYYLIVNGYLYYDIFALFYLCTICPLLTYALSGLWETDGRAFIISLCAICFLVIYLLSGRELGGIDFSIVISYVLILYISKNVSSLYACALGGVLGLCINPLFAPIFSLCALVSGLLWRLSSFLAIFCAFVLSCGYGIFTSGYGAIAYLVPEILLSSLVSYPILRFDVIRTPSIFEKQEQKHQSVREVELDLRNELYMEQIENMSGAFFDVANLFRGISKSVKEPSRTQIEQICYQVTQDNCYLCPKNDICWEKDKKTTNENLRALCDGAFFFGEASKSALDSRFLHRCPNVEKIISEINQKSKRILLDKIRNDKLDLSAACLETTARLISSISDTGMWLERNIDMQKSLLRLSSHLGIKCDKIEVFGKEKKRILLLGVDVLRSNIPLEELKKEIENDLKTTLNDGTIIYCEDTAKIEFCELPQYKIKAHALSVSFDKAANGDNYSFFKNDFDKEYFLLCDGMGSGAQANLTSSMCVSFLEKILGVSKSCEPALSILNCFVRAKGDECSSSVDLLEVDVINGSASFYKSGASASYIKRGENVFEVSTKTSPIGIMKSLDCQRLSFDFESGDICVMVSDGITNLQNNSWLEDFLKQESTNEPEALANKILEKAKDISQLKDDTTVIVINFE